MNKKGFTLAEMLIVLAILGVVGTLLITLVQFIIPDQNEAKVRKAYNTIFQTIQYLTNEEEIYNSGVLQAPDDAADKDAYFCTQFADQLSTTGAITCTNDTAANTSVNTFTSANIGDAPTTIDTYCGNKRTDTSKIAFKTSDGVSWYGFRDKFEEKVDAPNIDYRYVTICIDPDITDNSVAPYAFGVRRDGKIIVGARAQNILDKTGKND